MPVAYKKAGLLLPQPDYAQGEVAGVHKKSEVDECRSSNDLYVMGKVGRNHPCPCGSGIKYKRCHGANPTQDVAALPPSVWAGIERSRRQVEAIQHRRRQQQGLGRPIISEQVSGLRVVAVGSRLYYSSKSPIGN